MNPLVDRPSVSAERRTWAQRLVLVLNVALITTSLTLAGLLDYAGDRTASVNRVELHRSLTDVADAESGGRVINVLLVGSDSSAALDPDDPIQVGRDGERFGDVLIIAHIDERSGDVALLSLPRDLWVPIAGTDRSSRINRAFLVGGPAVLIDTIEMNFDIPIHHYVNVDFAGFQGLVDTVGSVDVYFDTPARDWNVNAEPEPRSQTGFLVETPGCHALGPEQALAYVRSRYYQLQAPDGTWHTDPTSDLGRIARQQDFLQRLLQEAIDQGARNPLVLADLIDTGIQHVAIDQDLTPALLLDLSATYRSFEPGEIETFTYPAVDDTVGSNRVLLPRHDDAEALRALFGGRPFTHPDTIAVRLLYDSSLHDTSLHDASLERNLLDTGDLLDGSSPDGSSLDDSDVADWSAAADGPPDGDVPPLIQLLTAELADVGFEAETTADDDLAGGLWIRHGPDGSQAAAVVAAALAAIDRPDVSIVELPHIEGRDVDIVIGPGSTPSIGRDRVELAAGPERTGSDRDAIGDVDHASGPPDESVDPRQDPQNSATVGGGDRQGVSPAESGDQSAADSLGAGHPGDQRDRPFVAPERCS